MLWIWCTDAPRFDLPTRYGSVGTVSSCFVGRLKPFGTPPEVKEGARGSIGMIVRVCERHALKGVPLPEMRAAMWAVLSSSLMHAIARYEPRLQERSEADAFGDGKAKAKRIPRGLTVKGKVFAMIERGGTNGITKTDLIRGVRPKLSTDALVGIIGELGEEGAVVWGEKMRLNPKGRCGVRLFASAVGVPKVGTDGTMLRRD